MSIIGPRPQLVRDMVFMTDEQRMRHTAKPGLSGLAQTRGRNALSWDAKLATDLEYIENGFGPVVKTKDHLIKELEKILENNLILEGKYKDRIDGFFAFSDTQNCERTFHAIKNS